MPLSYTLAPIAEVTNPVALPTINLSVKGASFMHLEPKLYNKLPKNIASCATLFAYNGLVVSRVPHACLFLPF